MMDEGALGVHQVELVVDAGEHFGNGSAVRDPGRGNLRCASFVRNAIAQRIGLKGSHALTDFEFCLGACSRHA